MYLVYLVSGSSVVRDPIQNPVLIQSRCQSNSIRVASRTPSESQLDSILKGGILTPLLHHVGSLLSVSSGSICFCAFLYFVVCCCNLFCNCSVCVFVTVVLVFVTFLFVLFVVICLFVVWRGAARQRLLGFTRFWSGTWTYARFHQVFASTRFSLLLGFGCGSREENTRVFTRYFTRFLPGFLLGSIYQVFY